MRPETPEIKAALRAATSIEERLAALKGSFAGRDVFLLTCGPSLGTIDRTQLVRRLQGEVVICVKQTFDDFAEIADFHLINAYNHQRYSYDRNPATILIAGLKPSDPPILGPRPDLVLPLEPAILSRRLAVTRDFAAYELDRTPVRPWGPGIVYELGIFLAVHLGARNLFVAGWDLGAPGATRLAHYYDRDDARTASISTAERFAAATRGLPLGLGRPLGWLVSAIRHLGGKRYNRAPAPPDEVTVVAHSTPALHDWLRTRGLGLYLLTENEYFDERIPRVGLPAVPHADSR